MSMDLLTAALNDGFLALQTRSSLAVKLAKKSSGAEGCTEASRSGWQHERNKKGELKVLPRLVFIYQAWSWRGLLAAF